MDLADTRVSKKRMHMVHEMFGQFSAKSDFIRYFGENL